METKRKTTRNITGMLAAFALVTGTNLVGNTASALSNAPQGPTAAQCEEAWNRSPARQASCYTASIGVADGSCEVRANCDDAQGQSRNVGWSGAIEDLPNVKKCLRRDWPPVSLKTSSC